MSTVMAASAIVSSSTHLCSSSPFTTTKSTTTNCYQSTSVTCPRNSCIGLTTFVPSLGLTPFSPWNGLRHLGISISQKRTFKFERKGRYKGKVIYASLFGVGAPEALVIGVVALLVFGPKGLAEVARNLGKTLRAFQPTIRELQDVSREFKSTLEREIGLDEISNSAPNNYTSNIPNTISTPSSTADTETTNTISTPSSTADTETTNTISTPSSTADTETANTISTPSSIADTETTNTISTPSSTADTEATNTISTPSSTTNTEESQTVTDPNGATPNKAYTSEEYLKITQEQLEASARQQQGETLPPAPPSENQLKAQPQPQGSAQEAAAAMPPSQKSESEI